MRTNVNLHWISLQGTTAKAKGNMAIDQSIRLRPQGTCEQKPMSLSNTILHNSAACAKHTHMHVGPDFVRPLVAQWVVIGQ